MAKKYIILINICLLLTGCTRGPWLVDAIATGNAAFDSSRYQFASHSPLSLEITQFGDAMSAILSLKNFRIKEEKTLVAFAIGEEKIERELDVHEGKMRIKVPEEILDEMIRGLESGKEVQIVVDGFELDVYELPKEIASGRKNGYTAER